MKMKKALLLVVCAALLVAAKPLTYHPAITAAGTKFSFAHPAA